MATAEPDTAVDDFRLIHRGPSYRLGARLGFERPNLRERLIKIALLLTVTWAPLYLLALLRGHLVGSAVAKPLLYDPEANARFLFVLPLLEFASGVVGLSVAVQARHFLEMGLVPKDQVAQFQSIQTATIRIRESSIPEAIILVIAYLIPLVTRVVLGLIGSDSSWERAGSAFTFAGWWNVLVSLPILYFFVLRWVWIYLLWAWFLFRVSRLDLQLTPTHPDRAGGLGFVAWGLASFSLVLMALSATVSAGFADEILHKGASLNDLKIHVAVFVVLVFFVLYAPLCSFSRQLAACRFEGLLQFGKFVWEHDRAFDEKWIKHLDENRDSLLGNADIQSLVDAAAGYEHINEMWLIPFDAKAFAVLMISVLLPLAPLVGTSVPLQEIFMKLGELLI